MDTLSRDSSSSSNNIVPMAALVAGGLALVLAIVALVKLSTLQKTVAAQDELITQIPTLRADLQAASTKTDADLKNLRTGVQSALDQVGTTIGGLTAQLTKLEEQLKKPAPAATAAKGGAAAAPTGVRNSDGTYTVAAGDTPTRIAAKFGLRLDAVLAENPGLDPSRLRVGQRIRLPNR